MLRISYTHEFETWACLDCPECPSHASSMTGSLWNIQNVPLASVKGFRSAANRTTVGKLFLKRCPKCPPCMEYSRRQAGFSGHLQSQKAFLTHLTQKLWMGPGSSKSTTPYGG